MSEPVYLTVTSTDTKIVIGTESRGQGQALRQTLSWLDRESGERIKRRITHEQAQDIYVRIMLMLEIAWMDSGK